MRFFYPAIFAILLTGIFGCTSRLKKDRVVTIDGETFLSGEFFTEVDESRFRRLGVPERTELVEEFTRKRIVMTEARKRGIDREERIAEELQGLKETMVVGRIIAEDVWEPLRSDSSLRMLYAKLGRAVGTYHILITHRNSLKSRSDRSEKEALDLAWQIRKQIDEGQLTFSEAAKRFSEGPGGVKGGNLGYARWGELFEPVQSVAFSLEHRQLSEPIRSDFGYHLVWVIGVMTVPLPPFEEEVPSLRAFILSGRGQEKQLAMRRFQSILLRRYRVHFNDETIDALLKEFATVHEGLEGPAVAEEIAHVDLRGVICKVGGEVYDVKWFQDRIGRLGKPISDGRIVSTRSLRKTLEHVLSRFLITRYAEETRSPEWHYDVDQQVRFERFEILRKGLIEKLSQESPDTSQEELIQSLLDNHTIQINENFVASYRDSKESI